MFRFLYWFRFFLSVIILIICIMVIAKFFPTVAKEIKEIINSIKRLDLINSIKNLIG